MRGDGILKALQLLGWVRVYAHTHPVRIRACTRIRIRVYARIRIRGYAHIRTALIFSSAGVGGGVPFSWVISPQGRCPAPSEPTNPNCGFRGFRTHAAPLGRPNHSLHLPAHTTVPHALENQRLVPTPHPHAHMHLPARAPPHPATVDRQLRPVRHQPPTDPGGRSGVAVESSSYSQCRRRESRGAQRLGRRRGSAAKPTPSKGPRKPVDPHSGKTPGAPPIKTSRNVSFETISRDILRSSALPHAFEAVCIVSMVRIGFAVRRHAPLHLPNVPVMKCLPMRPPGANRGVGATAAAMLPSRAPNPTGS